MDTKDNTASAPVAATVDLAITERMEALTVELSALMGRYANGRWTAIIGADDAVRFVPNSKLQHGTTDDFLDAAPTTVLIEYHLSQLTLALRKRTPGLWTGHLAEDGMTVRISRNPDAKESEAWISFGVAS